MFRALARLLCLLAVSAGPVLAQQAAPTPKHFAVHSGPEPARHTIDVKVSLHDMEDTYLPAFRQAVIEGKAYSVMCAYNRINGEPACANTFLLGDTLRGAWKFNGYVVSDCGAIAETLAGVNNPAGRLPVTG